MPEPGSQASAVVSLAGPGDLDTVARLIADFREWFGKAEPALESIRASVERIAAADGEYLLAAGPDGTVDGVLQLRYRWSVWTDADDAWIEDVFVRERARRHGLGRALVEAAIERARERGCRRVELDVDEANAPARALYAELGFADDLKAEERSLLLGKRLT